jgi:hypothetical protein
MTDGKVTGDHITLKTAHDSFNGQVKAIARLVEQVRGAQQVNTGDGSLDGLIGGLVSEIVAGIGEFGENGVQSGATVLAQMAANFQKVNQDVQSSGQPAAKG